MNYKKEIEAIRVYRLERERRELEAYGEWDEPDCICEPKYFAYLCAEQAIEHHLTEWISTKCDTRVVRIIQLRKEQRLERVEYGETSYSLGRLRSLRKLFERIRTQMEVYGEPCPYGHYRVVDVTIPCWLNRKPGPSTVSREAQITLSAIFYL